YGWPARQTIFCLETFYFSRCCPCLKTIWFIPLFSLKGKSAFRFLLPARVVPLFCLTVTPGRTLLHGATPPAFLSSLNRGRKSET
ncbi:MAG TPA: hypothetical protein PK644_10885, partial [bacterium]|nr:hypothetical protein [bacterium]